MDYKYCSAGFINGGVRAWTAVIVSDPIVVFSDRKASIELGGEAGRPYGVAGMVDVRIIIHNDTFHDVNV